jgi:DNA-binding NtrC family response regulator
MSVAVSVRSVLSADSVGAYAPGYRGVLGASPAMRELFAMLARLEQSLTPVLIEGESGVGKELVARALHQGSRIAAGPHVVLNCGALPRELLASELFGHRRGAFTGALDSRRGAFESAHGGTLFLDEIGELPLDLQPMLLRALESGEIRPVGGDTTQHVQVRLIAATNRDLLDEVRHGRFREDLFYRIAVVRLRVPALRERRDDIPLLADKFARDAGLPDLPPAIHAWLAQQSWDGNVRELRNAVQSFAALGVLPETAPARRDSLEKALRAIVDPCRAYAEQKDALVERFTAVWLEALLELTDGNQTEAARLAGLDRGYLGRLIARHGLGRYQRGR